MERQSDPLAPQLRKAERRLNELQTSCLRASISGTPMPCSLLDLQRLRENVLSCLPEEDRASVVQELSDRTCNSMFFVVRPEVAGDGSASVLLRDAAGVEEQDSFSSPGGEVHLWGSIPVKSITYVILPRRMEGHIPEELAPSVRRVFVDSIRKTVSVSVFAGQESKTLPVTITCPDYEAGLRQVHEEMGRAPVLTRVVRSKTAADLQREGT
jgi:hypothetical protein